MRAVERPGLVDKNKPLRVKAFLHLAPGGAGVLDIRAFLLGGMQGFFDAAARRQSTFKSAGPHLREKVDRSLRDEHVTVHLPAHVKVERSEG